MYRLRTELIQQYMKVNGWNSLDLAKAMHVTDATVSRVLSGNRRAGFMFITGLKEAFPLISLDLFFERTIPFGEHSVTDLIAAEESHLADMREALQTTALTSDGEALHA